MFTTLRLYDMQSFRPHLVRMSAPECLTGKCGRFVKKPLRYFCTLELLEGEKYTRKFIRRL